MSSCMLGHGAQYLMVRRTRTPRVRCVPVGIRRLPPPENANVPMEGNVAILFFTDFRPSAGRPRPGRRRGGGRALRCRHDDTMHSLSSTRPAQTCETPRHTLAIHSDLLYNGWLSFAMDSSPRSRFQHTQTEFTSSLVVLLRVVDNT